MGETVSMALRRSWSGGRDVYSSLPSPAMAVLAVDATLVASDPSSGRKYTTAANVISLRLNAWLLASFRHFFLSDEAEYTNSKPLTMIIC